MTWTDASSSSEFWTEVLDNNEIALLDESGNELVSSTGAVLIDGIELPWSDAAANAETWAGV